MLNRLQTLADQGVQNNQQIMAIILEASPTEANAENAMYDKLQKTKEDANTLLKSDDRYMDVRLTRTQISSFASK